MHDKIKKFLACPHHNVQSFTEYCFDCGENRYTTVAEIMKREGIVDMDAKPTVDKKDATKAKYSNPQAFWKVTTEGDCEGRSTRDLGTHFGFIDDIAFALADRCYYSLCFKLVEPFDLNVPKANKVNITLDIDSGTWDMSAKTRQAFVEKLLDGRDTAVEEGQYYASVQLVMGKSELQRKAREEEMLRQQALAKLSPEERKALGI